MKKRMEKRKCCKHGFYIPVVLWADVIPMIGMLMIPKTCAYVWTVLIGYKAMKKEVA